MPVEALLLPLRMPLFCSFEIIALVGCGITRVLYFFVIGRKIILTNGFTKKTQKTPPGEIELSKKYRSEYEQRKENL